MEDDDEDEDEDEDSFSDSEDSNEKRKKKKPDKSLKQLKVGSKKTCDWGIEKERRKEFFNDI